MLLSSGLFNESDQMPQKQQKTPIDQKTPRAGQYVSLVQQLSRDPAADECYTPSAQVLPLLKYLDPSLTYYEATSGISSQLIDGFRSNGYTMVSSDSKDFFDCTAADVYDGIVTNPPYSLKDDFLAHCYALGKPFALLLPVASFQGSRRGSMFMKHGISALVYNNRVDFTGKGSPPFGNAWFIYGFIEPGQLLFANNLRINKRETKNNDDMSM